MDGMFNDMYEYGNYVAFLHLGLVWDWDCMRIGHRVGVRRLGTWYLENLTECSVEDRASRFRKTFKSQRNFDNENSASDSPNDRVPSGEHSRVTISSKWIPGTNIHFQVWVQIDTVECKADQSRSSPSFFLHLPFSKKHQLGCLSSLS